MRKRKNVLGLWTVLGVAGLLVLAMVPATFGQSTATMTGTVMDQSNAVVPNATVVLTDEGSGDTRRSVSNNEGYFVFTALQARTFKVRVELKGFQNWERVGIVVHPGDKINIDNIVLSAGAESQTITVSAEANEMVPVDSGEKANIITANQIQNLSIVGRDASELLRILPGMVPILSGIQNTGGFTGEVTGINGNGAGGKQSAIGNFSGNGGRADAIDVTADGAHVSDPGCNCATPVQPNIDMIQEFKVQGASFSAENSKGPVVISSVSKSGGSEYHGEVYYYGRESQWQSLDWYAKTKVREAKPNSDYRYPGFNIGGPVIIPGTNFNKNKDKLFFFFGAEWIRQNVDTKARRTVVPTEAMRAGDFTDANYITSLNGAYDNVNQVPNRNFYSNGVPNRPLDPGGLALLKLYPLPNRDPRGADNDGFNYASDVVVPQPMTMMLGRVDYSINDNTKLYVRYSIQRESQPFVYGLWWDYFTAPMPSRTIAQNRSHAISVNLAKVFSPTLTNEVTFGYTYIDFPNLLEDPSSMSRASLGYPYKGLFKSNIDMVPGISVWGANGGRTGMPDALNVGGFDPTLYATKHLVSIGDNVTKVWGTHTVKAGFYYEHIINKQPNSGHDSGILFPATWWNSKDSGNAWANTAMGEGATYEEQSKNLVNDEGYNVVEGFIQDSWKVKPNWTLDLGVRISHLGPWYGRNGAAASIWDQSRYSNNPADMTKYTGLVDNTIDPNVPLSGSKAMGVVFGPRVGMAYNLFKNTVLRGGFGTFNYHDAQQASALSNPPRTRIVSLSDVFLKDIETMNPESQKSGAYGLNYNDNKMPVTYNWNFTISQRLPKAMILETSYVGNKTVNLLNNGPNINIVPYGTAFKPLGENVPDWNVYRPMQNYNTVGFSEHSFSENYNSLQVLLSRQTGRLTYSASYTFGKMLGYRTGGPGTTSNAAYLRNWYYGVLAYDRTHTFNIAYSFLLPDIFKGNAVGKAIINGWQFSGITTLMSGANLSSNMGAWNLRVRTDKPGAPGEYNELNQANVTGSGDFPMMPKVTCNPSQGLDSAQHQFVNGACFAPPGVQSNGDFQYPYIHGPWYNNHDLALFKNFKLGKSENRKLQLRFAGYNFLNHPVRSFEGTSDAALKLDYLNGQLITQDFGQAKVKYGKRIIQVAIKFMF